MNSKQSLPTIATILLMVIAILLGACGGTPAAITPPEPSPTPISPTETSISETPSPTLTPTPEPPRVIEPENIDELTEWINPELDITGVAFTPDGRFLVGYSQNCCFVNYYDIETLQLIRKIGTGGRGGFAGEHFALTPDGNTLAIAVGGGLVGLWDTDTEELKSLSDKKGKKIYSFGQGYASMGVLSFSPDGHVLATIDVDTINLWYIDTEKGQLTDSHTITYMAHGINGPTDLAFSPDGNILAIADGEVKLRDTQAWRALPTEIAPQAGEDWSWEGVTKLAFSHDGKLLATATAAEVIQLWDVETGQLLNTLSGHENDGDNQPSIHVLAFSPDDRLLVSGSDSDFTLRFWGVETGELLRTIEFDEEAGSAGAGGLWPAAFSPDGKTLAVVIESFEDYSIHTKIYRVLSQTSAPAQTPTSAPTPILENPVEWKATAESLGWFGFSISEDGKSLAISRVFYNYECKSESDWMAGEIPALESPTVPVVNRQFIAIVTYPSETHADYVLTIKGKFDEAGKNASGTWIMNSYGTICASSWKSD